VRAVTPRGSRSDAATRAVPAILNAGALAGALDLAAACVQAWLRGRTPLRVLQGIAAGWLGRESFAHGVWSGALGFVTHFSIATAWAALYWFASRALPPMVRHPWWSGAAFALVVYTMMYEVVIPLSAIHRTPSRTSQDLLVGLLIHVTCVGWPIALVVRAHTPRAELGAN
jgi:hypothetical protein